MVPEILHKEDGEADTDIRKTPQNGIHPFRRNQFALVVVGGVLVRRRRQVSIFRITPEEVHEYETIDGREVRKVELQIVHRSVCFY